MLSDVLVNVFMTPLSGVCIDTIIGFLVPAIGGDVWIGVSVHIFESVTTA